jgi:uncharacterized repeat protein (TIGR03987 family)
MENGLATVIISLALVFYTVGVWSERFAGKLKAWHLVFFWLGIIADTWGTGLMFKMSGGMNFSIHGISGLVAIVLMFVHAVWATRVIVRENEKMIYRFHRFSVFVWCIWLIPYFSPMVLGMI